MSGYNRYYWPIKFSTRRAFVNENVKCIFISYQNNDKEAAVKIADYLISIGVNVYFDEYDGDLKRHNQKTNPDKVTESLCKGINNSSHMLVVVSPTTVISKWVPFEIGYGYDKTELYVLCLKGIAIGQLPEYVRTAKVIRDIYDLNSNIKFMVDSDKKLFLESRLFSHNSDHNPLDDVMDKLIIDSY